MALTKSKSLAEPAKLAEFIFIRTDLRTIKRGLELNFIEKIDKSTTQTTRQNLLSGLEDVQLT